MGWRYVVRRLLQVVPAVAAILVITFGVIHLAPGDPVDAVASGNGDAQYYAFMRHKFGLDKPVVEQFRVYVGNVLRGDLGVSFAQGDRVSTLIRKRLGPTLLLMGTALVASSVGGVVFGLVAARRPLGLLDFGVSTLALVARVARTGLMQQEGTDYVRTARMKGLSASVALVRHALPNALLPVVTVIGTRVGTLFSGAVLVETVFGWPGLGGLLLSSAQNRDHPVMLGLVLLVAFSVVLANLVTDLTYAWIDPRIRYR